MSSCLSLYWVLPKGTRCSARHLEKHYVPTRWWLSSLQLLSDSNWQFLCEQREETAEKSAGEGIVPSWQDLPHHPHSTVVASPAFPRTLVENLKERKSRQSCVAMCYPIYLNTLGLGAGSGKKPQA